MVKSRNRFTEKRKDNFCTEIMSSNKPKQKYFLHFFAAGSSFGHHGTNNQYFSEHTLYRAAI